MVENERDGEVPTHLRDASRDSEEFGHGRGYLYPHAYRDHWVAQQYLPDTLQGKLFYQPGELGHEAAIRDQVNRRREAQLAAMLEAGGAVASPEVLTFTPAGRERDRWLERAVSGAGDRLAQLRDRVLDAAALQRHHLALDLNAASGLITWEAARRTPEGGVWALAADAQTGEALRRQASRLREVERPVVLIGDPLELPDLLHLRGDDQVRFDAILGRHLFTQRPDKGPVIEVAAGLLRQGGSLCLAEVIPRHGQLLTALVDLEFLGAELAGRVRAAEEAIYRDAADPMVNWETDDLIAACIAGGLQVQRATEERERVDRRISQAELDRWFATQGTGGRPSYAEHLLSAVSPAELDQISALYRRQLKDRTVPWESTTLYLVATAE